MKSFIYLLFFLGSFWFFPAHAQTAKGDRILAWQVDMAENNNYDSAFYYAQTSCIESIHLSSTWANIEPSVDNYDTSVISNFFDIINIYYPATGTKVELQLAPINTNNLEVPTGLEGMSFDSPAMISQFKKLLDTVFEHIPAVELSALNIGNEHDIYMNGSAAQYAAFKIFLDSVSPYAKQLYFDLHGTDLLIGTTFTHSGLVSPGNAPLCQSVNIGRDIISATYYPLNNDFTMKNPNVVTGDFNALVAQYSDPNQPIYFAECGYASSPTCNSSEQMQADFFTNVFLAWDAHYDNIKYLTLFKTTDWSQTSVDQFGIYYGISTPEFLEYLRTLGVRTYPGNGTNKLAYDRIKCELSDRSWCATNCTAGLSELLSNDVVFTIHPNPTKDQLNIELSNDEVYALTISDINGKNYLRTIQNVGTSSIEVSALDAGIYFVTVTTKEGKRGIKKMIVQ